MITSPRIASLLPGGTEIICALELEASLVGISHLCDYPPGIQHLPRLTAPTSQANSSVYHVDTEGLRALRPDVVLTPERYEAAVCQSVGTRVDVLSLQPTLLQDIWDDIHRLGEVTGRKRQADTLLEQLFARVNTILAESIMLRDTPRVAVLTRYEPLMLAGYWIPEMIQLAGGSYPLCKPGAQAFPLAWEALQASAPDVIILAPCGYTLAQTRIATLAAQELPGWQELPAVRCGRVYGVDGQAYIHRPGPRIVESLEFLAGLIHPDLFGEFLPPQGQGYDHYPPP